MKLYKKAQGDIVVILGSIIGLVTISLVTFIGLNINESVKLSMNDTKGTFSATSNATYNTVVSNVNSGFNLIAVAPLLLAATGIIVLLVGFASVSRMMRQG